MGLCREISSEMPHQHRICGAKIFKNANSRLFSEQRNFFDTDKFYPVVLSDVMCINALICAKMCAAP